VKKLLIGVVGLVVLLLAAALIIPSFINWNEYKGEIAAKAKEFTGRDLVIGGDIGFSLLPAPTLEAEDLSLGNAEGGVAEHMVRLKSLDVRVAILPLLSGNIQVTKIKLVEPVVELEALADGRKNWEFAAPSKPAAEKSADPSAKSGGESGDRAATDKSASDQGGGDLPVSVQFDSLEIEDGVVVYRDAAAGTTERVEDINASIVVDSLTGPFEGEGELTVRGLPAGFRINVGDIGAKQPVPVGLTLTTESGAARVDLRGIARDVTDSPAFEGTVGVKAGNPAELIHAAGVAKLPGFISQSFDLSGDVAASSSKVEISKLEFNLGKTRGNGGLSAILGDQTSVDARLALGLIDLDSWLAMPATETAASKPASPTRSESGSATGGGSGSPPRGEQSGSSQQDDGGFGLPKDLSASLALSVEAMTYRDDTIRQAKANVELAGGEITVSHMAAILPGATQVEAFGFVTSYKRKPRFDGNVEVKAGDFPALLRWLQVDTGAIPPGRLSSIALTGKLSAVPDAVQMSDIDLSADGSRAQGRVSVAMADRPVFGANLSINRFNLNPYLQHTPTGGGSGGSGSNGASDTGSGKASGSAEKTQSEAKSAAFDRFDANVKVRLGKLAYKGALINDVILDANLFNGVLDIKQASVGDVAGSSGRVSGTFAPLSAAARMRQVNIDLTVPDLPKLLKSLDVPQPELAQTLGPLTANGRVDGTFTQPTVDLGIGVAGGETRLNGDVNLEPSPGFNGSVEMKGMSIVRLARALGSNYTPSGKVGTIDLAARLDANASQVSVTDIDGSVGGASVKGSINVDMTGQRPAIDANLATGHFRIDQYLPAKQGAALTPRLIPASWRSTPQPVLPNGGGMRLVADEVNERWSRDPIDLSALKAFDANLNLKSSAISYGKYTLENADLVAILKDGVFSMKRLTGLLFGGPLQATARLDAAATPRIDGTLSLDAADVGRAAVDGNGKPVATGRMAFDSNVTAAGGSMAALVSALDGTGSIALNNIQVGKGAAGAEFASMIQLLEQLNRISAGFGKGAGASRITATYRMDNGVAISDDIVLESALGNGGARANINLPQWYMDASGQVTLSGNILTGLVVETEGPQTVPFRVRGSLDDPAVTVDPSGLKVKRLVVPNVKALEEEGLGVLRDVLEPLKQAPADSSQNSSEKPKRIRPEDVLKKLFR
jgi:hypothetical protein